MNQFVADEIRAKCTQIRKKGVTDEGVNKIIRAYKLVLKLCDIARNEGLLALEDSAKKIDTDCATERFLVWMIGLIINGEDPEVVEEYGIRKTAALDMHDYDGLILMFYIKAVLWIQAGHNSWGMQNLLLSFCPYFIEEELRNNGIIRVDDEYDPIAVVCECGSSECLFGTFMEEIKKYPEPEMRERLQNTELYDLALVMKGLSCSERRFIFDLLPEERRYKLANEFLFKGPCRVKAVHEACDRVVEQWKMQSK